MTVFTKMDNHTPVQRWANSSMAMLGIDSFSEIAWMRGCLVVFNQKEGTQDEQ